MISRTNHPNYCPKELALSVLAGKTGRYAEATRSAIEAMDDNRESRAYFAHVVNLWR